MKPIRNAALIALGNLLFFASCLFAVFLFFELFPTALMVNSWWFPYLGTLYQYEMDPELIFRSRPMHMVFETFGDQYRTEYKLLGANPTKFRAEINIGPSGFEEGPNRPPQIIALGDSYLQVAADSRDSFPRRLETTSGLATLNRGLAWYGPFQYLEVFRRFGPGSGAHIALFCFTEGTDLADITEYLKWKAGGDYYEEYRLHADTTLVGKFWIFLTDFTALPSRLGWGVKRTPESFAKQLVEVNLNGKFIKAKFPTRPESRTATKILSDEDGRQLSEILSKFKSLAEKNGILPIVVFLPTAAHIYGPFTTENSGATWKSVRAQSLLYRSSIEMAVRTLAEEKDLQFIDLVPPFESRAAKGEMLYHPFDSHWNSLGRQAAADVVAARLGELGKIP